MLFNSVTFIAGFLPAALALFYLASRIHHRLGAVTLVFASLFFYAWWDWRYLGLLLLSVAVNFTIGTRISQHTLNDQADSTGKGWLTVGIVFNLGLLGLFKYAGFLVHSANAVLHADYTVPEITLPLGISFFTFTQIAYLVDVNRGLARDYNLPHYSLFVTYFPHLIAGPILHHSQMMPQFARPDVYQFSGERLADGLTIFLLGLAKKVLLADRFGGFAWAAFDAAAADHAVTLFAAWGAALSYTLQLYFDFSGYSDMAIGLGRMVGIQLPQNFASPYKARSIIDFWRRWHMTLSAFLREYLYIPLGGNRLGPFRRYLNIMVTMLLGGLWHGAGWTFVLWGGLHGLFLLINHAWRALPSFPLRQNFRLLASTTSWTLTFLCVVVAWVFFRANSLDAALIILRGMAGQTGVALPNQVVELMPWLSHWVTATRDVPFLASGSSIEFAEMLALLTAGLLAVLFTPTIHEQRPRTRRVMLTLSAALTLQAVFLGFPSDFLYFQF